MHTIECTQTIIELLVTDKYLQYDYSDCLSSEYTIPTLLMPLIRSNEAQMGTISYDNPFKLQCSTDRRLIGSTRYITPSAIALIFYPNQPKDYIALSAILSREDSPNDSGFEPAVSRIYPDGRELQALGRRYRANSGASLMSAFRVPSRSLYYL